jgi:hypothetical protein
MATLTHPTSTRDAITNAVVDLIDGGTGTANGALVFLTAGDAEVASLNMSNPAFDASGTTGGNSAGVATAEAIFANTNCNEGTVTKFEVRDRDGGVVFQGDVTDDAGTGSIQLSSTNIGSGDTLSVSTLTYTAPA